MKAAAINPSVAHNSARLDPSIDPNSSSLRIPIELANDAARLVGVATFDVVVAKKRVEARHRRACPHRPNVPVIERSNHI